mmetsp:Transcript_112948/g.319410  ORF Transcript_112948/g.319410 Transcript_112948/m.319410 type:complete len:282 (+) Transcript_112948:56-901(+)|eukprot:CAMPEP_0117518162 /NCGR_PEP_ID=MMETSP0784-20121206/31991_1 /TAXON_ID=39447 /ORGANISM="" /LENGTH=281 /DNA_ID=CAMNT_0005314077 /DNA_START=52 /DNA_END=897 /DNA_ORIENTATION=-
MASVENLLNGLLSNSRGQGVLNSTGIDNRLKDLRAFVGGLPHYDHDEPDPPRARAVGDPMLIDANGITHHYWGSALMVVCNQFGIVTALEYLACTADRNYLSEVWRHEIATGRYKYRNLDETPGTVRTCVGVVEGPEFVIGDPTWPSEAFEDAKPPDDFLRKFKGSSRTFFINGKTGSFMQGPDFGALRQVLESPVKISKAIIGGMRDDPRKWMQAAVEMITSKSGYHYSDHEQFHQPNCPRAAETEIDPIKKIQVAQFVCGVATAAMRREPLLPLALAVA